MRKSVSTSEKNISFRHHTSRVVALSPNVGPSTRKSFAMALYAICCVLLMAGFDKTFADEIPSLSSTDGTPLMLESRTQVLKSNMQVYLSPISGRPIPADHADRVSQILSPLRAQAATAQSPLAVMTSQQEKGGKFIITGPHFRSHMHASVINGDPVGLCTVSALGETHTHPQSVIQHNIR